MHTILNRQTNCSCDDKIAKKEKFILYAFNKESMKISEPE